MLDIIFRTENYIFEPNTSDCSSVSPYIWQLLKNEVAFHKLLSYPYQRLLLIKPVPNSLIQTKIEISLFTRICDKISVEIRIIKSRNISDAFILQTLYTSFLFWTIVCPNLLILRKFW